MGRTPIGPPTGAARAHPLVIAPVTYPSLRAKRGNPGRTPLVWIASSSALATEGSTPPPRNDDAPRHRGAPPVIAPVTHPSLRAKRGNPGGTPLVWIASSSALATEGSTPPPRNDDARHAPRPRISAGSLARDGYFRADNVECLLLRASLFQNRVR
ncbi:MAG: hypothetical protein LBT00_12020 [Spirochaetaceae bacterium]|nr:hypothetical protein [Spirochaetaceae bacterium]